ncbi:MAG TPA: hypothetical protein VGX27_05660 [Candidatus Dormibacteraeota bacterium]|nr:hypothetical protein [Candidatus Dormibacteraeota bacterium]
MRARSWAWTLVAIAVLLIAAGIFVLSFRSEPSAVGRLRTGLDVIGGGCIAIGVLGGATGAWMLVSRRT